MGDRYTSWSHESGDNYLDTRQPTHSNFILLNNFNQILDLDRALLWGISGKLLTGVVGPITALLIAYKFSPELQGYHYTFLSLVVMQTFAELGLSTVIVTFASHEWADLRWDRDGGISGEPIALSRLSSLVRFAFRWFLIAAAVLVVFLLVFGFIFLSGAPGASENVEWRGPWIGLCLTTGVGILLVPILAILQGCGRLEHIYFYRFIETMIRALAMWSALLLGAGLWAGVIGALMALMWAAGFIWHYYYRFFSSIWLNQVLHTIVWKSEILPLQWRIAVSWLSGYLMFSIFTPALFYFQGPVIAGQMGMTWALIGGISGLAGTWIQVKVPGFGALVAQRKFPEMERQLLNSCVASVAIACIGGIIFLGVVAALDHYAGALRARLLPLMPIILFLAAEVLNQISLAQSSYMRAFKREPFLILSVAMGSFVGCSTIVSARYFDVTAISIAYLAATLTVVAWGSWIFLRFRGEWASASAVGGRE